MLLLPYDHDRVLRTHARIRLKAGPSSVLRWPATHFRGPAIWGWPQLVDVVTVDWQEPPLLQPALPPFSLANATNRKVKTLSSRGG